MPIPYPSRGSSITATAERCQISSLSNVEGGILLATGLDHSNKYRKIIGTSIKKLVTDIMIKFKVRRGKTKVKKTVIKARTKLTLAEFESPRVAMQNELISKNTAVILKPR